MVAVIGMSVQPLGAVPRQAAPHQRPSAAICARGQQLGGFLQRRPLSAPAVKLGRLAAQKQQFKSFDNMIQESTLPVLIDFYAAWCGPCQMMSRTLEAVAPRLKHRVKIVKIDSEKYDQLASKYGIQGLPTLILFKGGKQVDRLEGMLPEADFMQWLQQRL